MVRVGGQGGVVRVAEVVRVGGQGGRAVGHGVCWVGPHRGVTWRLV